MHPTLLYLLKANVVLLIFVATYYGLLRRLTFFGLNRAYLLFALGFAAVYPALPVPALFAPTVGPLPTLLQPLLPRVSRLAAGPAEAHVFDWQSALLLVYIAGMVALLTRLLGQLLALAQLHQRTHPAHTADGLPYRQLIGADGPFSFWQTIYLNPAQHSNPTELAAVLRHEQAHVQQWHTADVLLAHLATSLAWLNPAAWLLRRALLDNLEFLADRAALDTGLNRQDYQYTLLRLHPAGMGVALVSPFTFLTLKNRVAMMNTPTSAAGQKARYFLAVPLLVAAALGFAACQRQAVAPVPGANAPISIYYIDGQESTKDAANALDPKTIASMQVLKGETARQLFHEAAGSGVAIITTTANQNLPAVVALNEKLARATPVTANGQTEAPTAVSALPPAALAYIGQHYPGYRLTDVTEIKLTNSPVVRYRAGIAIGRRPEYITFDAAGQPVEAK